MKREVELVILSDVHLGTYGCHARELYNYLKGLKIETLILNGDFIDIWSFRRRYFPREHMLIIQRILRMAAKGTKVYYITGNHDDLLRRYSDFSTGNLHLRDKLVLHLNGKKYWIFHGDVFDAVIQYSPLLARIGGKGYDWLIWLNRMINKLRRLSGRQRMSFTGRIKHSVKEAVKFIGDFEDAAIKIARQQEYDYVICGHIHRPAMRSVDIDGRRVTYLNSGDWVENLTALEYNYGRWSIYEYDELDFALINPKLAPDKAEQLLDEDLRLEARLKAPALLQRIMDEAEPLR